MKKTIIIYSVGIFLILASIAIIIWFAVSSANSKPKFFGATANVYTIISDTLVSSFVRFLGPEGKAVSYAWKFLQFVNYFGLFDQKKVDYVAETARKIVDSLTTFIGAQKAQNFSDLVNAEFDNIDLLLSQLCASGDQTMWERCDASGWCGTAAAKPCVSEALCQMQTCQSQDDCKCGKNSKCFCINGLCQPQTCCRMYTDDEHKSLDSIYIKFTTGYNNGIYSILQAFTSLLTPTSTNTPNFLYRSEWAKDGDRLSVGSIWNPDPAIFKYYNADIGTEVSLELNTPLRLGVLKTTTYTGSKLTENQIHDAFSSLNNLAQLLINFIMRTTQVGMLLKKNSVNWYCCLSTALLAYMFDCIRLCVMYFTNITAVTYDIFMGAQTPGKFVMLELRNTFPTNQVLTTFVYPSSSTDLFKDYWIRDALSPPSTMQTFYITNLADKIAILVEDYAGDYKYYYDQGIPSIPKNTTVAFHGTSGSTITIGGCRVPSPPQKTATTKNNHIYTVSGTDPCLNLSITDSSGEVKENLYNHIWPYKYLQSYDFEQVINDNPYLVVFQQLDADGKEMPINESMSQIVDVFLQLSLARDLSTTGPDECKTIQCPEPNQIKINDICYTPCDGECADSTYSCQQNICVPPCPDLHTYNPETGLCDMV
jgi:hypothetical protein